MPETAENIKKVAVIMDGQQTQFLELDQVTCLIVQNP